MSIENNDQFKAKDGSIDINKCAQGMEVEMGYIFVSYSRRQMYFAEAVALHLQQAGFEVWFDLQKLGPGVDWGSALKDGYSNCEKLVLIASKAAIASRYVQVEWEAALHKERELIVVVTEAVTLPESLRNCPTYDARTHFDRTIQSLIAYLRGEQPALHDAVPAPGRFPLPLTMPFAIWFTIFVMALPAISMWITTALFPVGEYLYQYAIGFGVGIYLLVRHGIAAFRFWRHSIRFEEMKSERWNLLFTQAGTSLVCWLLLFLSDASPFARLMGILILLFPLVTVYWAFRVLGRSADILRWFSSGDADQEMRESIQGKLVADQEETTDAEELPLDSMGVSFAVHYHPADKALAEQVASVFEKEGCKPAPEKRANTQLIIVTNRTSKQWLVERNNSLPGKIVNVLGTNIDTSPELQPVLQKQVVDFRMGRLKTIQALASRLANEQDEQISYGMQVAPKGFSHFYSVPFVVWLVWTVFALAAGILILWGWKNLSQGGAIAAVLGVAVWLCFDLLMMRKISLPAFLHKMTGNRFAWFASPGHSVKDPVGMDKKSRMRLIRWGQLALVVFTLADLFQPSSEPTIEFDPEFDLQNYEFKIDGTPFRKIDGDTFIMIDGTPVPFIVDGTRVATLEP